MLFGISLDLSVVQRHIKQHKQVIHQTVNRQLINFEVLRTEKHTEHTHFYILIFEFFFRLFLLLKKEAKINVQQV